MMKRRKGGKKETEGKAPSCGCNIPASFTAFMMYDIFSPQVLLRPLKPFTPNYKKLQERKSTMCLFP